MKIFPFLLMLSFFFITSCGSEECDPNAFAPEVNAEVDNVNAVGVLFANDASEDNCQAYKKAAEDYRDTVEKFENCEGVDQNQYNQQLGQARSLLDAIPCN